MGSTSSTAPISFEKRFRILPEGLVWKKRIGARVMLENMLLCRRVDARIAIEKNMNERRRETTTRATTMPVEIDGLVDTKPDYLRYR